MSNLLTNVANELNLEECFSKVNDGYIAALNHISHYILDKNTDLKIKKNLIKLLVLMDTDGNEFVDTLLTDWKDEYIQRDYRKILNVICPIIIKEQKRINKGDK